MSVGRPACVSSRQILEARVRKRKGTDAQTRSGGSSAAVMTRSIDEREESIVRDRIDAVDFRRDLDDFGRFIHSVAPSFRENNSDVGGYITKLVSIVCRQGNRKRARNDEGGATDQHQQR